MSSRSTLGAMLCSVPECEAKDCLLLIWSKRGPEVPAGTCTLHPPYTHGVLILEKARFQYSARNHKLIGNRERAAQISLAYIDL